MWYFKAYDYFKTSKAKSQKGNFKYMVFFFLWRHVTNLVANVAGIYNDLVD